MSISRSRKTVTAIALFLVLAFAVSIVALPTANAHTPPWTIPTYAYIDVSPSPIGVGQSAFVTMWIDKVPPTAGGIGGDRWQNFTVKVTKPNGDIQTLGPYTSDTTSAAFTTYTPDQVGTYKFVFSFPGQVATLKGATGIDPDPSLLFFGALDYINDTYSASSATTYLIVQQEPVTEPPTYPLPTEYWTRPIEGQNTAWASVASNWLGAGVSGGSAIIDRVQPNGVAPNSPHIMWTKPFQDGGVVGDNYSIPGVTYYSGLSYEGKFGNPIIMNGRLYYDTALGDNPTGGPYTCVDLQTGQTLWENPNISPTFGQLYLYESFNQHGVIGDGYLIQTIGGVSFFGPPTPATWIIYDARTGNWLFNLTNIPPGYGASFLGGAGSGANGPNGELLNFVLGGATFTSGPKWLALWNSSASNLNPLVNVPGIGTDAYQYRPVGKTVDMGKTYAYTWNVTLSATLPAGSSIIRVIPDDMILGATPLASFLGFGTPDPFTVWAISLKPTSRGSLLWMRNYPAPAGNITRAFGPVDPKTRVWTMTNKETMQWLGFDLDTGDPLWGPVGAFRAFQYYGIVSHPPAPGYMAYGNLYVGGYGGELHCFDARKGTLLWKYNNTFSAHETPWGNYPLYVAAIADGKIYCFSGEHSPNAPPYKGSRVRCINATTGEEIWTLLSWYAIGSFGEEAMPVADGKIVYLNTYDMQIYCIGKGPSLTTVTAPDTEITLGQGVVIKGTVTDQSAGAKKLVQDGKFSFVPAMTDESMGPWMEYLYMQKPIPTNVKGVTVTLDVIDANGNYRSIGTATTDMSGTFGFVWKPDIPGKYMVIATFMGSESYYASYAETYAVAVEAPAATPTPTPLVLPPTDTYILYATIAIILAIAIVGILLLRKHS